LVSTEIKDVQVVWPEKFDEKGRPRAAPRWNLPFQVIEAVNETRATREAGSGGIQRSLFEVWSGDGAKTSADSDWKNKLVWGDNKYVMSSLLQSLAGQVNLIYIDPPFNTGDDFSHGVSIGEEEFTKEPSAIEVKAYRDTWAMGTSSYLDTMYDRILLMKELLSPSGSVYVHLDENVSHYVKGMMDEIFGRENFINEIVWQRTTAHSNPRKSYGRLHDVLLFYSKSEDYVWNQQYIPYSDEHLENSYRFVEEKTGRKYASRDLTASVRHASIGQIYEWKGRKPPASRVWSYSKTEMERLEKEGRIVYSKSGYPRLKLYLDEGKGVALQDVWTDIRPVQAQSNEKLGYPTQKPEALLERIIVCSSNPNDIVADFFCGSGTTLAVAEKLGRRWIGCDLSRFAIHTARKRLLEIQDCRPFQILNLGKYERQVWQGLSFAGKEGQSVIYEYLAFILKLYDAQPISGFQSIHGRRAGALIHVGSVDAPVTIIEVMGAVEECISAKQDELHVLGWEWEMGIHDLVETEAKKKGVKVLLKQIPSDVMDPQVSKEDVHFFDLAYVKAKAAAKKTSVQVELQDFGIPSNDLIPSEVRKRIRHWSDLVDYWAIDFDFKNDTFLNSWQAYRIQDNPKLDLKSTSHEYDKHGKHQVLVKVVDIFGIDSSKLLEVEV
jgi:DNA modification methylase